MKKIFTGCLAIILLIAGGLVYWFWEDIAESWTHFVLQPKPAGDTVSEKKVLFFYDFPELVELREEIVARTFSRLRRQ